MAQALPYAPTPPIDRVETVWQGDEFDITLPPHVTLRALMLLVGLTTVTLFCWFHAIVPGAIQVSGGRFHDAGAVMMRLFLFAFGAVPAGWIVTIFRQMRTWARITLRREFLIFEVPALRGMR